MHFDNVEAAIAAADPEKLTEKPDTRSVAGCCRCLLSYYNQPDHELIDRTNPEVKSLLLRLARSLAPRSANAASRSGVRWR